MTSTNARTPCDRGPIVNTVHTTDDDLTAAARIRKVALRAFAERGVPATSIRDVAKAAGVSAGVVQHHFKTKDALRGAVNDYVVRIGTRALQYIDDSAGGDVVTIVGERLTAWMREDPTSLRYLARAIADGDRDAIAVFDSFVHVADTHLDHLDNKGALRDELDHRWAALHVILMNLATALLEPAISRHLNAPLDDDEQLRRWRAANQDLFRAGLFKPGNPSASATSASTGPTSTTAGRDSARR